MYMTLYYTWWTVIYHDKMLRPIGILEKRAAVGIKQVRIENTHTHLETPAIDAAS